MKITNTLAQLLMLKNLLQILAIYFKALWACPGMPYHIQKNLTDQNVASMAVKLHEKSEKNLKFILPIVFSILKI